MKLIVKSLIKDDIFGFQPSYGTKNIKFTDLFYTRTTEITLGKLIDEYLKSVQGNRKAALSQGFNLYGDNTELITMGVAEREARLAKDSNYNL